MSSGCMQDYIRIQPDNLKTYNIVGEIASYLCVLYANINSENIDLVIEIFVRSITAIFFTIL